MSLYLNWYLFNSSFLGIARCPSRRRVDASPINREIITDGTLNMQGRFKTLANVLENSLLVTGLGEVMFTAP